MVKFLTTLKLGSDYSRDDQPVFASRDGTPLGHRNVTRRGFEGAAKEAGIDGVSFHSMRHACASRMIDRDTQALLDSQSLTTAIPSCPL
jgi:integrase